jgi:PAS domain S-box-containing protein
MNTDHGNESLQNLGFLAGFPEMALDAMVACDTRERVTYWNPAAEQMFGWTAQEALGKTTAKLFWPLNIPEEKKNHKQRLLRLKRGETLRDEHNVFCKDGSSLYVQYVARAVFDAEGKVTGYLTTYRDVSDQDILRRQKAEALRARTEEIETLLGVSPVAIFVAHDPKCIYITGNPAGYRLVELPRDANISKSAPAPERPTYRTFRKGVEVPAQDLPMQKAARLGVEVSEDELELRFEDGSQKFIYAFAKPLFDPQGQPRGAVAAMLDITERKRSEQLIQESEERFRNIFDQSPIGIGVYNADGVLVNLNRAAIEMFGIPNLESALGLKLFSSPTVQSEAKLKLRNQEQIQEEVSYDFDEIRRLSFYETTKTGISYFNRIITPLRSSSAAEPFGYLSQVLDISERTRAEEQLVRSNQKLNEILASIQDDFYVIDHNWNFVYANRQFTTKLQKEPEDLIGNNVWTMFPKHAGRPLEENFRAAMEKREMRRFEIPGQYTNAWYGITVFPSPEGITVLGSDITEHKRLQAETESMAKFPQENPNPVLRVSQEGVVLFGNRASQKLLDHWNCSIGTPLPAMWREKVSEQFRLGVSGEALLEFEERIFLLQLVPILENHYLNIYGRDITERKQAEEALHEHQRQLQLLNKTLEQQVHEKTEEVRHLASDLVKAVQHERHRISHILHDDLQQRIYAMQMQLAFLHDAVQKENPTARQEVSDVEAQLAEALRITRHLSIDLSPPILRDEGLLHAINWLAVQMRQRYNLPIEIQANGSFAIADEALHVLLFNCVRELLFNVVKHAEASRAVVTLEWLDASIQIGVSDNGKGFPVNMPEQPAIRELNEEEEMRTSFGLSTIRHQLSLFGGRIEIQSEPGAGTQVLLTVPVAETE